MGKLIINWLTLPVNWNLSFCVWVCVQKSNAIALLLKKGKFYEESVGQSVIAQLYLQFNWANMFCFYLLWCNSDCRQYKESHSEKTRTTTKQNKKSCLLMICQLEWQRAKRFFAHQCCCFFCCNNFFYFVLANGTGTRCACKSDSVHYQVLRPSNRLLLSFRKHQQQQPL